MSPRLPSVVRRLLAGVGIALVLLGVFVAGIMVGGHPRATGISDLPPALRDRLLGADGDPVSSEVLGILEDEYYVRVDPEKLQRASVDALLASLKDPYTFYLDPEQYAALQRDLNGQFDGVGMTVDVRDGAVVVTGVYDGSPAQKAGIRPGDRIVSVDGTRVGATPSVQDVVDRIRGRAGTTVTLGIRTGDRPVRELTLTRARIRIPAVQSRVITRGDRRIGYVRLLRFDRGASGELRRAVDALEAKGVSSFVFDLRGDPGGLVDEAVKVANVFLPDGTDVVTIQGLHRDRTTLRTDGSRATDLPVTVLVDANSASASEIVAGALRDERVAPLVGTHTFGKALVQTTRPLRNGGALRYTSARYLTPSGYDLAKRGLQPDVRAKDDPATPRDEALNRAVAVALASAGGGAG